MSAPRSNGGPAGSLLDWARAVCDGLADTARAMLSEGRRGAREAQEEGWRRYEAKTKQRRRRGDRE